MTAQLISMTSRPRRRGAPDGSAFAYIPPNWFAVVMGTGIVAVGAHGLPGQGAVLRVVALGFWGLTCLLYLTICAATVWHWLGHPAAARAHLRHPVIRHFYGAMPMATLTVGTTTLLVGSSVISSTAALIVDLVCFGIGTVGGLVTAFGIGLRLVLGTGTDTGTGTGRPRAFGGWLMSVVPPMVSASAAAMLATALPAGMGRMVILVIGYAMFAVSVILVIPIGFAVLRSLLAAGIGPAAMAPTWWIVLGPLGQSVTAAVLLGRAADNAMLRQLGDDYALVVWVVAACWIVVAGAITVHTARAGLPFALTWWSFTFPLGTFVTGTAALAGIEASAGFSAVLAVVAVASFAVLVTAWAVVAARTAAGIATGALLVAPA